jgi:hypothetical protein
MPDIFNSLPMQVATVLIVSLIYGFWLWTRLRIGRYDALWCSALITSMQFMSAFRSEDPPLALIATFYHAALVVAVFSASRGLRKAGTQVE